MRARAEWALVGLAVVWGSTFVVIKEALAGISPMLFIAARFLLATDAPFMTVAGNKLLTAITNLLFGSSLTDMETCYKVMRGDIARSLQLSADRFDIEPEITARLLLAGHRIVERPVRFAARSRSAGKKMRWRDGWMALQILAIQRLRGR